MNLTLVAAVTAVILWGSLRPTSVAPSTGTGSSALVLHVAAYFALAGALVLYFHDTGKGLLEAALTAVIFGLAIELVQSTMQSRFFSTVDIAANAAGASLVLLDHRVNLVTEIVELEDRAIEAALEL